MSASACVWRPVPCSWREPKLVTPFFLRNFTSLPAAWELEAPVIVGQP